MTSDDPGSDRTAENTKPEFEVNRVEGAEQHDNVVEAEIVDAESVGSGIEMAELVSPPPLGSLPPAFENLAAIGGAVGSLVLGVWSILGSLLTPYAAINSGLGLILGAWGMTSKKKKLAMLGIVLSIAGFGLSLFEISRFIQLLFAKEPTI